MSPVATADMDDDGDEEGRPSMPYPALSREMLEKVSEALRVSMPSIPSVNDILGDALRKSVDITMEMRRDQFAEINRMMFETMRPQMDALAATLDLRGYLRTTVDSDAYRRITSEALSASASILATYRNVDQPAGEDEPPSSETLLTAVDEISVAVDAAPSGVEPGVRATLRNIALLATALRPDFSDSPEDVQAFRAYVAACVASLLLLLAVTNPAVFAALTTGGAIAGYTKWSYDKSGSLILPPSATEDDNGLPEE